MNIIDRIPTVRLQIVNVMANACNIYGIDVSSASIHFDTLGKIAGWADYNPNEELSFSLGFNRNMIINSGFDQIMTDTIPHEIAHLVCSVDPTLGDNHNAGWKRVCQSLGGTGNRFHSRPMYKNGNFEYRTTTGHLVVVSKIRHNKIQRGVVYSYEDHGEIDFNSYFLEMKTEQ